MGDTRPVDAIRTDFFARLPQTIDGSALWKEIAEEYVDEERAEVADEVVRTLTADCSVDEFHTWDVDHLEFIIELSNRHDLKIPRNLLNGLPEQLIIRVDHNRLTDPDCPD